MTVWAGTGLGVVGLFAFWAGSLYLLTVLFGPGRGEEPGG